MEVIIGYTRVMSLPDHTSESIASIRPYLTKLHTPAPDSHKGENGKVLIIGGSDLFHAASQWSFRVASRLVDMTFYSSVAENNRLLHDAKLFATDGVVVPRSELLGYLEEAEVVLIGPGMRRDFLSRFSSSELNELRWEDLTEVEWEHDTAAVVSVLLRSFPNKKWVIDAGALQVLRPEWVPRRAVLTPHPAELQRLMHNAAHRSGTSETTGSIQGDAAASAENHADRLLQSVNHLTQPVPHRFAEDSGAPEVLSAGELHAMALGGEREVLRTHAQGWSESTWIVKGPTDVIWNAEEVRAVTGGNAGMTKGGTGDALAGLIAGLWTRCSREEALEAVTVASWINKAAGHELYQRQGDMFNTSDLVEMIPVVWRLAQGF